MPSCFRADCPNLGTHEIVEYGLYKKSKIRYWLCDEHYDVNLIKSPTSSELKTNLRNDHE